MTPDVAVRIAGLVLSLPFLLGLLPGSLAAVGIGLVALGGARVLSSRDDERWFPAAAVAVLIAAAGVGAARWGSLDLGFIRGAQAILGPTVAVAPAASAGAASAAAVAGIIAHGLWLGRAEPVELWWAESVTGAVLLVTVFFGPPLSGLGAPESILRALIWFMLAAGITVAAFFFSRWSVRRTSTFRWRLLAAAGAVTGAAAALLSNAS